jgi:hypothetical protein
MAAQILRHRAGAAQLLEGVKDQAQAGLHFVVGMQNDLAATEAFQPCG